MASELNQSSNKYVYLLIDPQTNVPFYVGKGSGRRVKVSCDRESAKLGRKCSYVFVATGLTNLEALKLEIEQIKKYGRICDGGCLINKTLGGGGMRGFISEETKRKLSQIMKGKFVGKYVSDATREKMRRSHLGVKKGPSSFETRMKISDGHTRYWTNRLKQFQGA